MTLKEIALFVSTKVIDGAKSRIPPLCGGIRDFAGLLLLKHFVLCALLALSLVSTQRRQARAQTRAPVLISAVHYFGREGNADEAVRLVNMSDAPVRLDAGWSLAAPFGATTRTLRFTGQTLLPGIHVWLAKDPAAFSRQFGYSPTLSYAQLSGTHLSLANTGGWVKLMREGNVEPVDVLVYGAATPQPGWVGPPLQPYAVSGLIAADAQVLMRRFDPRNGLPITDTDRAADWLSDRADVFHGRRPVYPGWAVEAFAVPAYGQGTVRAVVSPDASFEFVTAALGQARKSITLSSYTFDNVVIGDVLAARAAAGVRVRVLLDGAPAGGLSDQTRWICRQLAQANRAADGGCRFMRSQPEAKIASRYRNLHAKYAVIDGRQLLIGSENFGLRGMPADDKQDGTLGHRGALLLIDAPGLVARAAAIFDADSDALRRDIAPWCAQDCEFGPPVAGFQPITASGGVSYTALHPGLQVGEPQSMTLLSSPETHLDPAANGLWAALAAAGPGDEIWVQQLNEAPFWGEKGSTPELDPNPRLQAYIDAARRGARVTLLLDAHYQNATDPRGNSATIAYLNTLGLPTLRAVLSNPAGLGVHNKMILIRVGGRALTLIGSWNGTETSARLNRELSVLVEGEALYRYFATILQSDLARAQPVLLPVAMQSFQSVQHLVISEIMINPLGDDQQEEWVELYNPTAQIIPLQSYRISDAPKRPQSSQSLVASESAFGFPDGAQIGPGDAIVIAQNAFVYKERYGKAPDYDFGGYLPGTPALIRAENWGFGSFGLANDGDEVALLQTDDIIVDVVTWLNGHADGVTPCAEPLKPGWSLQRWPVSGDTNSCTVDFRQQSVPSPGSVP
jgi:cardiolipin synthase A/B